MDDKPLRIGVIGHVDHGKTALTHAIKSAKRIGVIGIDGYPNLDIIHDLNNKYEDFIFEPLHPHLPNITRDLELNDFKAVIDLNQDKNMLRKTDMIAMIAGLVLATKDEINNIREDKISYQHFEPVITPAVPPIPKGHTLFVIEGVEIYALNHKNALKKYNKLYNHDKLNT